MRSDETDPALIALKGLQRVTLFFFVLIVLTGLLGGCTSPPEITYANVQDGFNTSVRLLIEAKKADEISDEEWTDDVLPLINLGDALLDTYWEALQAGLEGEGTLIQIKEVARDLAQYLLERQLAQDD